MKISFDDRRGFTLVEMVMVLGIFAVASTALYSLYITHLKSATHHDQLLEVQQNMRIALDTISRDLMMAGILVPSATTIFPDYDTTRVPQNDPSVRFYTASADRVFARITHSNRSGVAAFKNLTTSVDPGSFLDFNVGDVVRIVRPAYTCSADTRNEPLKCQYPLGDYTTMVVAASPASGVINLTRANSSSNFDSGITLNQGDVIAKKGGYTSSPVVRSTPDIVNYYLAIGTGFPGGNGCPTGQTCLFRSVNGAQPGDVIAGYMKSLNFAYNTTMISGQSKLVSIGVKLVGTTAPPAGSTQAVVTREMDTLIKLRQ